MGLVILQQIFSVFFSSWWPGEAIGPGNTDGAELDPVAGWPGRPLKPEIQIFPTKNTGI